MSPARQGRAGHRRGNRYRPRGGARARPNRSRGRSRRPEEGAAGGNRRDGGAGRSAACCRSPAISGQPDDIRALFARTEEAFGRLDLLFNNAGVSPRGVPFEDLSLDDWQRAVDVNLTAAFLCAQEAFRIMTRQTPKGGRIVNNGSVAAYAPRPRSVAYSATKHAITGLTRSLALDGREHDIACSQIDVGNAETPMTAPMKQGIPQPDGRVVPEPVFDVDHVGDAIAQIAALPLDTNVLFMTIMATKMPFVGRG